MNYRHSYHAGNHADVFKHAVLSRILTLLGKKEKPFFVLDAFAGAGIYDLVGTEAAKTGEWESGIGKFGEQFDEQIEALLAPYRKVIGNLNPYGALTRYPGSPWIASALMRPFDRIIANDLQPQDRKMLARVFENDRRVSVTGIDAEMVIKANLPPPERRGLVLIDPPYEAKDEFERALRMLAQGFRRFATGCFVLWYPLKGGLIAEQMAKGVSGLEAHGILRAELRVVEEFKEGGLAGSGLIIVNPPWQLHEELQLLLPALAARLGVGNWGQAKIDWLLPPK